MAVDDIIPPHTDEEFGKVLPLFGRTEPAMVEGTVTRPAESPRRAPNGNGNGHASGSTTPPPSPPAPPDDNDRPPPLLRSRSYAATVRVVEENMRDILEGRALEWNEMAGTATLNREAVTDVDLARIRYLCERRLPGGVDKQGNEKPMVVSRDDLLDAILQVGHSRKYHPVRSYLSSLKWDGRERLAALPSLMSVTSTELARKMIRYWFISAVARASDPGCQVDTMLVLIGPQGVRKSSFFRVLAGRDLFLDTPIDIHNKDAYITLRRAWIAEWPELETLNRARDAEAVKAFLTSSVDQYRPPFGRMDIRVPRAFVVVGTSNRRGFLDDETGGRRFWPMTVERRMDLDTIASQRDQLWAEALEAYTAGERWYLDDGAERDLSENQQEYAVADAWEAIILRWALGREDFTTADVLANKDCLNKPTGQWTKGDEMRVGRILTRHGFGWSKTRIGRGYVRTWGPGVASREPGSDDE